MIDKRLRQNLDAGGEAYLYLLTDLIESYEREHVVIPNAPVADVLRERMAANRLTQSELAKRVGIAPATISAILKGIRPMTLGHTTALARHLGITRRAFVRD